MAEQAWSLPEPAGVPEGLSEGQRQLLRDHILETVARLAGGVAHELNNVLAIIVGHGERLAAGLGAAGPQRGSLEEILRGADRAAGLVRRLLAFSGRHALQPQALDLNALVRSLQGELTSAIGRDVTLVVASGEGLGRVRADGELIGHVIRELAANARDAMPCGGRLRIETANVAVDDALARRVPGVCPGPYVRLAVSDTGTGMDAMTLARTFEPFFTTKPFGVGAGLGLSAAYGIVRQHGGAIAVESATGQGTVFTIYLPEADGPAHTAAATPEQGGTAAEAATVLVVEDEPAVLGAVEELLRMNGHTVLTAADGPRALDISAAHPGPIHLLLTDVVMPGIPGPALARQVTAARPETRVLYMSGYPQDMLGQRGVLEPGTTLLQKPFRAEALVRTMREVLRGTTA